MKKAVIFDMDGVLVDNSEIHVEAFVIFCQRYGINMAHDALKTFFGMGNDEIIPAVLGREIGAEELAALADEKEALYREIFASRIAPMAGLVDMLEGLKQRGVKIAVGSSGSQQNVDFVLSKCGIAPYFDAIANGDMITRAKPDPEVFLLAASLLGVAPEDCVVFEDSFAGIKAARTAGMGVVAVSTTYTREEHGDYDAIIDDFTQISVDEVLGV